MKNYIGNMIDDFLSEYDLSLCEEFKISFGGRVRSARIEKSSIVSQCGYIVIVDNSVVYPANEFFSKVFEVIRMSKSELEAVCLEAYNLWGPIKQCDKLIEECIECLDAAYKVKKYSDEDSRTYEHLLEEMTDVEIVITQLRNAFGQKDRDAMIRRKISKLKAIMRKEKNDFNKTIVSARDDS